MATDTKPSNKIEVPDSIRLPNIDETEKTVDDVKADSLPKSDPAPIAGVNGDTSEDERPIKVPTATDAANNLIVRLKAQLAEAEKTKSVAVMQDQVMDAVNGVVNRHINDKTIEKGSLCDMLLQLTVNQRVEMEWDVDTKSFRYPQVKPRATQSAATVTNGGNGERATSNCFMTLIAPNGTEHAAPMRGESQTSNDRKAMVTLTGLSLTDAKGGSLSHSGMHGALKAGGWSAKCLNNCPLSS